MPQTQAPPVNPWITQAEAAKRLGIHIRTLRMWANQGKIARYRVGDSAAIRYRVEDIDALVQPTGTRTRPFGGGSK